MLVVVFSVDESQYQNMINVLCQSIKNVNRWWGQHLFYRISWRNSLLPETRVLDKTCPWETYCRAYYSLLSSKLYKVSVLQTVNLRIIYHFIMFECFAYSAKTSYTLSLRCDGVIFVTMRSLSKQNIGETHCVQTALHRCRFWTYNPHDFKLAVTSTCILLNTFFKVKCKPTPAKRALMRAK